MRGQSCERGPKGRRGETSSMVSSGGRHLMLPCLVSRIRVLTFDVSLLTEDVVSKLNGGGGGG